MNRLLVLVLALGLIAAYSLMGATAASGATPKKQIKALKHQVHVLKKQRRTLRARVIRIRSERNDARAVSNARGRWLTESALRWIASNQTHSWQQDSVPIPELAARLRSGERLYITCGTVARLGVYVLQSYGLEARVVHILSLDPPNGIDDGHIVMETRLPGGEWEVYDLDANRKPVDATGAGMTTAQFVDVPTRQYNLLANDQSVDWTGARQEWIDYFSPVFASSEGLERWYDHILGVSFVGP